MSDTSGTYRRVGVLDAARILGVSPTTVRRMVKAGTLQVERVLRPQGHTFLVLLPPDIQPGATTRQQVSAEARTEAPPSEQMATFAAGVLAPILTPLLAEQTALRQTVERQAGELGDLRETIGRQGAELSTARGTLGELQGRYDQSVTLVTRLVAAGVALAILALVAVTLAATGWTR